MFIKDDPCWPTNPCQNGGTCIAYDPATCPGHLCTSQCRTSKCKCASGYWGSKCTEGNFVDFKIGTYRLKMNKVDFTNTFKILKDVHLFTGIGCFASAIDGVDKNEPCKFPFKYKGFTLDSCTFYDATNAARQQGWCATKVNSTNHYEYSHWGTCAMACPKEYSKSLFIYN